jgi:hypothetical protein
MLLLLIADVAANRFLTVALFEWHLSPQNIEQQPWQQWR